MPVNSPIDPLHVHPHRFQRTEADGKFFGFGLINEFLFQFAHPHPATLLIERKAEWLFRSGPGANPNAQRVSSEDPARRQDQSRTEALSRIPGTTFSRRPN